MPLNPVIANVTRRIVERSRPTREAYLAKIDAARGDGTRRRRLSCGNLAHGFAGCGSTDKAQLRNGVGGNIAVITAYNDMLSAHQPYETYPEIIRRAAREVGATAQVAGGVPAMCDGVTQGRSGMELSLFSRDVIALSAAIALSHDMFDSALYLGICDKIVPGLLIAALTFGHLPSIFVPAGPMPSGISNDEKAKVRQKFAEGKANREELLEAEARSYHSPGTCTFYGTANSNQMLMEIMGLHTPGASFVHPNTPLREALTIEAAQRAAEMTVLGDDYRPVGRIINEHAIVNGVIGLHATGGSTNHLLHMIAIARAGGMILTLDDFDALSQAVPLLARVYPNGRADVNHFDQAGGMGFLIDQLLDAGLLHGDIETVWPGGFDAYRVRATLGADQRVVRERVSRTSGDDKVLRGTAEPFRADGGLRILHGNLGDAAIKVSAVPEERWVIEAPAVVFDEQETVKAAFDRGELDRDCIVVVRFQGPQAIGMPELHKLTPVLGILQDRGFKVALVTDGRMSGASGKVPAAIHLTPEAQAGGPLARVCDGDVIRVDAKNGTLQVFVDDAAFAARPLATAGLAAHHVGLGRELFARFRANVSGADSGASLFGELA